MCYRIAVNQNERAYRGFSKGFSDRRREYLKFLVVMVLMVITLTGCVTERIVVVEKEKDPGEEYIENFKSIIKDVEKGGNRYARETITIRAVVLYVEKQLGGLPTIISLKTNNKSVSAFSILVFENLKSNIIYRPGLAYTFTVYISRIASPPRGYVQARLVEKEDD